jgi:dephospho-CoA kinase
LAALESITHPYIGQRIREEIDRANCRPEVRLIVLDAALLLEAGWHDVCTHTVFVDAPREVRLQRLEQRRGWKAREMDEREKVQMPTSEKRRRADAVVDNSGAPEQIAVQVRELLARWG